VCDLGLERPIGGASVEFHYENGPFTLVPAGGNRANLVWIDKRDTLKAAQERGKDGLATLFAEKSQRLFGRVGHQPGRLEIVDRGQHQRRRPPVRRSLRHEVRGRKPGAGDLYRGREPGEAPADDDRVSACYFASASRFSRPLGMMTEPPYDPTNSASK
jgi:hypothetical protein